MIIGITGDIGSGKSTFAKLLSSAMVLPYYDLDQVAKVTMHYNSLKIIEICEKHGMSRGESYSDFLHDYFFTMPTLQLELAECIKNNFPMKSIIGNRVADKIIESAILYQQGLDKICDIVIMVDVEDSTRIDRLISKRGMSQEDIQQRLDIQRVLNFSKDKCHFIVDNSGNELNLLDQAKQIAEKLKSYESSNVSSKSNV
jgi:dephospho-CoA kinase